MKTIDRRRLLRGVLFGSAAGLAFAPIAATAMPLGVSPLPGALDEWIEKAQAVVVRPAPVAALGARFGVAGGIEAAAFAAGAGFNSIAALEPWL